MSEYGYMKGSTDRRSIAGEAVQNAIRPSRFSPGIPPAANPGPAAALNGTARVRSLIEMQRMLDTSPRLRPQHALQHALNGRAAESVIQRAKLRLCKDEAGTISGVEFSSRPGSNVRGARGQHLTVYVA